MKNIERKFFSLVALRCRTHVCHGTGRSCRGVSTERATRDGRYVGNSIETEKRNFILFFFLTVCNRLSHLSPSCSRPTTHTYLALFLPLLLPDVPSSKLILGGRLYLLLLTLRVSAKNSATDENLIMQIFAKVLSAGQMRKIIIKHIIFNDN